MDTADIDSLADFPSRICDAIAESHVVIVWWSLDYSESNVCSAGNLRGGCTGIRLGAYGSSIPKRADGTFTRASLIPPIVWCPQSSPIVIDAHRDTYYWYLWSPSHHKFQYTRSTESGKGLNQGGESFTLSAHSAVEISYRTRADRFPEAADGC